MSKWLLSILAVLAIICSAGVTFVDKLDGRLARLESESEVEPDHIARLTRQLSSVRAELADSRTQLGVLETERARQLELMATVEALQTELATSQAAIEGNSVELAGVGQRQDALLRESLGEGLQTLEERWNDVSQTLEATARIAEDNRHTFNDFVRDLPQAKKQQRDVESMWVSLLGPTVQIADESTVGSGVLLKSEQLDPETWRTYLLTAFHVVRDVLDEVSNTYQPIPTYIYSTGGDRHQSSANLVEYDVSLDVALLVMYSEEPLEHGAALPTREVLSQRRIFDSIYAVGCPLGNDPIPTHGEIADTYHEVDGDLYWMISAPTYIGNSGGGIFDAESFELLGIFSKIYTHGNLRPTVVPHMGLVTPLSTIYDWLDQVGQGSIIPE